MTLIDRIARRMRPGQPVIVVSGLPRSGTSMTMSMLAAGGMPLLVDGRRLPDESNPNGYFEFEAVKLLEQQRDLSWLPHARGKAVKIISLLLTWLPENYDYRVVFMQRDVNEIIASQDTMLQRNGQAVTERAATQEMFVAHLKQTMRFLQNRACFSTLEVNYRDVLERPSVEAERIARFVGRELDIDRMTAVVDSRLYRNKA